MSARCLTTTQINSNYFLFILNHQIITQYINEPTVRSLRSLKESFYSVPSQFSIIASGSALKFERIFWIGKSWIDINFKIILVNSEPTRCQDEWESSKINWIRPHWLNIWSYLLHLPVYHINTHQHNMKTKEKI